jgi:hypothetical protein
MCRQEIANGTGRQPPASVIVVRIAGEIEIANVGVRTKTRQEIETRDPSGAAVLHYNPLRQVGV